MGGGLQALERRCKSLETFLRENILAWAVALDDEFATWLRDQTARVREEILTSAELLPAFGPQLGRPHVDRIEGSTFPNMKELRVQIGGDPWRIFFAFDPKRSAILLVGGDKTGYQRFYETNIPVADAASPGAAQGGEDRKELNDDSLS